MVATYYGPSVILPARFYVQTPLAMVYIILFLAGNTANTIVVYDDRVALWYMIVDACAYIIQD